MYNTSRKQGRREIKREVFRIKYCQWAKYRDVERKKNVIKAHSLGNWQIGLKQEEEQGKTAGTAVWPLRCQLELLSRWTLIPFKMVLNVWHTTKVVEICVP